MSMDTIVDIDSPSHAKNPSFSGMKAFLPGSTTAPNATHTRSSKKNVLSDKYVIGGELGRGAYGQVFKGLDTRTGEVVAIKRLSLSGISQDNLQNIMTEIELLKNLNHKHIVKYMGSFKTRTHLYIVLEYMENGALSGVIKPNKFGAFPEPLVAVCIEQVLQGLAYLHEQGVVHRDIKGANILTTKEGLVKLADFGVAAKLGELEDDRDFRDSVVGTPYWMAPEVIEMTGVTAASDIWSVACLAIELLTGQPPYYDLQPMSALFRIVQDNHPQFPPDISAAYEDFLTKCFQKDPQKRPDAKTLLQHPWISFNRRTLRSSWNRTRGSRARGARTDAHLSVTAVVERILQADAVNHSVPAGVPDPEPALSPGPQPAVKRPPLHPPADSRAVRDSATEQVSAAAAELRGRSDSQDELYNTDLEPRISQQTVEQGEGESPTNGYERRASGSSPPPQPTPSPATPLSSTSQTSAGRAEGTPPSRSSDLRRAQSRSDALGNMFTTRNSSGREPQDSPLEAILERLGHATPLPDAHKLGRDLMGWADDSERSPSKAVGQGAEGLVGDDLMRKREDAVEVRHLVRDLRMPLRERYMEATATDAARTPDAAALAAIQNLISMLKNNGERLASFMAEGGHVTVLELLTSRKHELFLPTLQLVNVLVSSENRILEQFCLMGLVPVILKFAVRVPQIKFDDHSWRAVRFEAALFVQHMCFTSSETARVLVACQAIPTLVEFVEGNFSSNAVLTHIGISCIWRLLEVHRALPLRVMCRLFAHSDLAHKLVCSLKAVMMRYKELQQAGEDVNIKKSPTPREQALSFASQHSGNEGEQKGLLGADLLTEDSTRTDSFTRELSHAHASAKEDTTSSSTVDRQTNVAKNGRVNRVEAVSSVNALPIGSSHHTRDSSLRLETLSPLMERMCDLLLVLSHASTEVKEAMCREETLRIYYGVIQAMAQLCLDDLLLKCVRVIKHLTQDPAVLKPLEDASTIGEIMPYLVQGTLSDVQLEVLHSLYNMCKISKERQEAAAKAGIVGTLIKFALPPQEYDPSRSPDADDKWEAMRPLAVSLLCQMAHTSNRTRTLLWNNNGLTVLLALLKDEVWQAGALDAVAAWLSEDREHQVEPRLFQKDALTKFVMLFQEKIGAGDMEPLVRQLTPFLKIMKRSPRFTVEIAQHGFLPVLLELLKKPHAEARRKLLAVIHVIYEHYPRPKELILKYHLQEHLKRLVAGNRTGQAILVQKQAQRLLDAFQINMVL